MGWLTILSLLNAVTLELGFYFFLYKLMLSSLEFIEDDILIDLRLPLCHCGFRLLFLSYFSILYSFNPFSNPLSHCPASVFILGVVFGEGGEGGDRWGFNRAQLDTPSSPLNLNAHVMRWKLLYCFVALASELGSQNWSKLILVQFTF